MFDVIMEKKSGSKRKQEGSPSGSKINECQIIAQGSEDWSFDCFNEDGILCLILSTLILKEAVRTCVLSRRWRCIWKSLPKLIFTEKGILDAKSLELYTNFLTAKDKCHLLMGKTDYFIQSVDSVLLQQHQGHVRVDEIHINYFLHKAHSPYLDAWVRFAVALKAKVVYLHLAQPYSRFRNIELYDFPLHLLPSSSIEELYLVACTLKPPYQSDFFSRLRVLAMWEVGDTGDDINHLVSLCSSSFKRLDVALSKELVSLSIPHSLSQLHTLTVEGCDCLTGIEVNAVNVSKIIYKGVPVDFVFRQPLFLIRAKICFITEGSDHNLNFYLTKLSKDLPFLQFLTLKINDVFKVENLPKCSSSFIHLKHLDWEWSVGVKMSHLHLDILFDAAPFLEKLKLLIRAADLCGELQRDGEESEKSSIIEERWRDCRREEVVPLFGKSLTSSPDELTTCASRRILRIVDSPFTPVDVGKE